MKSISAILILFAVLGFCNMGKSIVNLFTEKNHSSAITALAFSPKGDLVASAGAGTIIIRSAKDGGFKKEITGIKGSMYALVFSPDGTILAGGASDNNNSPIWLWDARTGELKQTLRGHKGAVLEFAFSPDGKTLASTGGDNDLIVWDLQTGEPKLMKKSFYPKALAFSSDGKMIAFSGIYLIDAETGEPVKDKNFQSPKRSAKEDLPDLDKLKFSPDGKTLIGLYLSSLKSDAGAVQFWSIETGEVLRGGDLTGHGSQIIGVAVSPDGAIVATGSGRTLAKATDMDSKVRLWDASGKLIRTMDGKHVNAIQDVAFSPDGSKLITGSRHLGSSGYAELIMWDVKTGKIEWSIGRK